MARWAIPVIHRYTFTFDGRTFFASARSYDALAAAVLAILEYATEGTV